MRQDSQRPREMSGSLSWRGERHERHVSPKTCLKRQCLLNIRLGDVTLDVPETDLLGGRGGRGLQGWAWISVPRSQRQGAGGSPRQEGAGAAGQNECLGAADVGESCSACQLKGALC